MEKCKSEKRDAQPNGTSRGFGCRRSRVRFPPSPQVFFVGGVAHFETYGFFVGGVAHFETYGFFVGGVAHFETYGPPPL